MATATATRTSPRRRSPSKAAAAEAAAAKRAALLERLNAFDPEEAELAKIDTWSTHYSERNALLIVMQAPEATDIRSYVAWKAAGRQVRHGEKGIAVLAPAGQKTGAETPADAAEGPATGDEKARRFFKLIYLFDVAQTEVLDENPQPEQ